MPDEFATVQESTSEPVPYEYGYRDWTLVGIVIIIHCLGLVSYYKATRERRKTAG